LIAPIGAMPHFFGKRCVPARKDRMWGAMDESGTILTRALSFLFQ